MPHLDGRWHSPTADTAVVVAPHAPSDTGSTKDSSSGETRRLRSVISPPLQLPVHLTSFIGREREIAEVEALLAHTRLLTLTGAGGSGKTRLALAVAAAQAERSGETVVWIELAPLSEPGILLQTVATGLGVREQAGQSLRESLLHHLEARSLLLVLDNCEHLVEACAALTDTLLRAAPRLRILATSREALGVSGETAWLVPPLPLPQPRQSLASMGEVDAVRLFLDRAHAVAPLFELTEQNCSAVAEICRRLDGMPLALELAAARVKVLTPEQIAQRLDDAFGLLSSGSRTAVPRHQTLRATIEWSHNLLTPAEQTLFRRLAGFAGGFSLEAAEAVCSFGELAVAEVLDLLAALVDRSLVVVSERSGEARYALLETVRQYAAERLRESHEEDAVQRRHAAFYLALAEEAEVNLTEGQDSSTWNRRLVAEHDNLRTALRWSQNAAGELEAHARLAGALAWFWLFNVHWSEGACWLNSALARLDTDLHSAHRGKLLLGAGMLSWVQGSIPAARNFLEPAVELARKAGDAQALGHALTNLAATLCELGDLETARMLAGEGVAVARTSGSRWCLAMALTRGLAYVCHRSGQHAPADTAYAEAEAIWRQMHNPWGLSITLTARAVLAWLRGDRERAAPLAREGVAVHQMLHDPWLASRALFVMAILRHGGGDFARAARLLGAAEALRESVGGAILAFERPTYERVVAGTREQLGVASFQAAWTDGLGMSYERALEYALEEPATSASPASPPSVAASPSAPPVLAPPQPSVPSADALEPGAEYRIHLLGPVEIYRGQELLSSGTLNYAKPRELLYYLLLHPQGRTKEQIGLALWPDASPAQVRNSFHVALHHLRKGLGRANCILFENDRYRSNPALRFELDVVAFEKKLSEARQALREAPPEPVRAVALFEEALALYRGDLLEEEVVGDWYLDWREELQNRYLDGLLTMGALLFASGEYARAAAAYQRALARNNLLEEAHQQVMRCYARVGERNRALRHYQMLLELLRAELDTLPDPETTALFESLRRGAEV